MLQTLAVKPPNAYDYVRVQAALGGNPNTPGATLQDLAHSSDPGVQRAVGNSSTPVAALLLLLFEVDSAVRRVTAANPMLPTE